MSFSSWILSQDPIHKLRTQRIVACIFKILFGGLDNRMPKKTCKGQAIRFEAADIWTEGRHRFECLRNVLILRMRAGECQ
mgnify:CR=1 FL=1